jgi:23S rRNA (adenine2503-C2)-methyltransferase
LTGHRSPDIYDYRRAELAERLAGWGYSAFHADLVWAQLYHSPKAEYAAMFGLRPDLRARLEAEMPLKGPVAVADFASRDGLTHKYLLRLGDGEMVETVLMIFSGRATVCVSTQVGCAMGCVFCATGQMGFVRHLSPGEIVAQVLHVREQPACRGGELRNVVFMGMGEPLHNLEATLAAIDILTDDRGLAVGPRYITVSTVGLPPAIRRLARDERPFNLAVSLHAATDHQRSALVPLNRRWPLDELLDACREYVRLRGRRIFFEWALISGVNDTPEQAHTLGRLVTGLDAHVNLIPLNPTAGYEQEPSGQEVLSLFQAILAEYGLPSTIRQRRGIDIDAGCGQLRTRQLLNDA